MFNISLMECARILNVRLTEANVYFTSVSIDTRTLEAGALFIALRGERWDGHDFIEIAKQKKALAVIGERFMEVPNLLYIQVADSRVALGLLAGYYRQKFSLPTIALTGSCGKTTTKTYLHNILSLSSTILASIKSFNNAIGLPLTLLALQKEHDFLLLEMGADRLGSIAWLTQLSRPTTAMILNVEPAHLKGFGSIKKVARAKSEIFQGLKEEGTAVLSTDFLDQWSAHLPSQKTIFFGNSPNAVVYAKEVQLNREGKASFQLVTPKGDTHLSLPLPGGHQVGNALAAAAAALANHISLEQIKVGIENTQALPGRLDLKKSRRYGIIIDDTYNATPHSVYAALKLLSTYPEPRIFVLGDMKELGEASDDYHRRVGKWVNELGIKRVFTLGQHAKKTTEYLGKGAKHAENRTDLTNQLKSELNHRSVSVIKGSRAMCMEGVVRELMRHNTVSD